MPFLPERKKLEKVEKLVLHMHDRAEYVMHIRNLKQALNHGPSNNILAFSNNLSQA